MIDGFERLSWKAFPAAVGVDGKTRITFEKYYVSTSFYSPPTPAPNPADPAPPDCGETWMAVHGL